MRQLCALVLERAGREQARTRSDAVDIIAGKEPDSQPMEDGQLRGKPDQNQREEVQSEQPRMGIVSSVMSRNQEPVRAASPNPRDDESQRLDPTSGCTDQRYSQHDR